MSKQRSASLAYYYRKLSKDKALLVDPFRTFDFGTFKNILTVIDAHNVHWFFLNDILREAKCNIRFCELAHRVPANVKLRFFKDILLQPLPSLKHSYSVNKRVKQQARFIDANDVFFLLGSLYKYDYRRFPFGNSSSMLHRLTEGGPKELNKYRYYVRTFLKDVTPSEHVIYPTPGEPPATPEPIIKVYTAEELKRVHNVDIPTVMSLYSLYKLSRRK